MRLRFREWQEPAGECRHIAASRGSQPVGDVIICPSINYDGYWSVFGIEVVDRLRRKRIGSQLYRRAAMYACDNGKGLMSDWDLSTAARGFWQKQVHKGRAYVVGFRRGTPDRYALTCPVPETLERSR
jgi:GNAT superfamily N-acetyltransferase